MWQSWSEWGRVAASTLLKIPVEGVIPTTNHLESFNAILKRKHLPAWLHSGRHLRFDSLIHILIMQILPGIYSHRKAQQEYSDWLTDRFRDHAGGENLAELHRKLATEQEAQRNLPVCFWPVDPVRDAAAEQVLAYRLVSPPQKHDANTYHAECKSQSTLTGSPLNLLTYKIVFHRSGQSSCSCPDFQTRGGACKHLRAMRRIIDTWVIFGHETSFNYISSHFAAVEHFKSLKPDHLSGPTATLPAVPSVLPPAPAWDLSIIQALGEDNTTVDDCEPGGTGLEDIVVAVSENLESGESSGTDNAEPQDCVPGLLGLNNFLVCFISLDYSQFSGLIKQMI